MPHHKSCKKRIVTSKKSRIRNRISKSRMHTATKNVIGAKTKSEAEEALKTAFSIIDKSALRGVIHKNKAANQKARLAKSVNKLAE